MGRDRRVGAVKAPFPFSAVVGQDEAARALLLAAVDRGIGGVLLRGDKGSAKSTLARGLAALLPDDAPFVELPIGATEDRVLGSLDLRAALQVGDVERVRPGLLAAADGGVLYVDEVNLLPDHLVDVLLDAAASGVHRVERDGVSHEHPARFVLVGSMNPEEGELRPQLLDRFGLAVQVRAPQDPAVRAEAVRRRLAHDAGRPLPDHDAELRRRLASARPAALPDEVVRYAAQVATGVGAESLRADLVLCRAAAALAGWEGHDTTTDDHVAQVAALALGHRRHRRPFDPPTIAPEQLQAALDEADAASSAPADDDHAHGADDPRSADQRAEADAAQAPADSPAAPGGAPSGTAAPPPEQRWDDLAGDALAGNAVPADLGTTPVRRATPVEGTGRIVGDQSPAGESPKGLAVLPTVRAAVRRRAIDPSGPLLAEDDVREPRRVQPQGRVVVIAVDTSGSMGTAERVAAATGAVLGLLADAYLRRDKVALVAFRGDGAAVVLPPTASVELARAHLAELETGGPTPLAEGIVTALTTAQRAATDGADPLVVVLTDGRATGTPGAFGQALDAANLVRDAGVEAVVLDAEDGTARLGLATTLAEAMGGRTVRLSNVSATDVETAIRSTLA